MGVRGHRVYWAAAEGFESGSLAWNALPPLPSCTDLDIMARLWDFLILTLEWNYNSSYLGRLLRRWAMFTCISTKQQQHNNKNNTFLSWSTFLIIINQQSKWFNWLFFNNKKENFCGFQTIILLCNGFQLCLMKPSHTKNSDEEMNW